MVACIAKLKKAKKDAQLPERGTLCSSIYYQSELFLQKNASTLLHTDPNAEMHREALFSRMYR